MSKDFNDFIAEDKFSIKKHQPDTRVKWSKTKG